MAKSKRKLIPGEDIVCINMSISKYETNPTITLNKTYKLIENFDILCDCR